MLVPLLPNSTVRVFGAADSEKLPNAFTVSAILVLAVKLADVPVTVTVAVPFFAVALAVRVRTLLEVVGSWLKDAVTPVGNPETANVTLPANPLCGVIEILLVLPAPPCTSVTVLGDAAKLKLWVGEFTVRLTLVLPVRLPDFPAILTVDKPVAAVAVAVKVSVLVLVAGFGLNDAVTPLGNPDADRVTFPLKPPPTLIVIMLAPLAPCMMATLFGEAESEKFGAADPASAVMKPIPFGLPHPVARS